MKNQESGFALLLVFAMAATIALLMYMQLPRVAFEAQRNKEQLLIERGEQYKRAIQLYFRKFKTYPPSIDALENTNNVRFLRRRYADPMTGKDEWRLIHIGPGGIFTDSLTNKPKGDKKDENVNNFITEGPAIGSTGDQQTSAAPRRRPSEGGQPQAGADPGAAPVAGGQPGTDQPPQADPGTGAPPPVAGQPVTGLPVTGQPVTGPPVAGQNPPLPPTQNPGQPTGVPPGVSAFPGIPGSPFNPGSPQTGTAPQDPTGQAPTDPNQAGSNQAADLLRNLLTRPRPQLSPQAGAPGGGSIAVGSIAGVASKVEKHSIKVYNEREKYNEWEFIYDFSKDRTGAGQMAGQLGAGDPRLSQQQTGQPLTNTPGFGGTSAFGPQSGTGNPQAGPIPPPTTPPPTTPPQ
jgi:type II secretory pathway pseudopilin PulG